MESKAIDILAGGITHELLRRGLPNDRNMLSASALVSPSRHWMVTKAHEDFLDAGATMIVTNNYYVTPGLGFTHEEIREYTQLAGDLAVEARAKAGRKESAKICGSLPPLMPCYRSDRTIDRQEGLETYLMIGKALLPSVDMFLAETMSSLAEAKMAYEAVVKLGKPVMVSFALNSTGQLRSGEPVVESVQGLLEFCSRRGELAPDDVAGDGDESCLSGILFNCSQPEDVAKALMQIKGNSDLTSELEKKEVRLGGYADHISPVSKAGAMQESLVPGELQPVMDMEIFSKFAARWIEDGAEIVGGCCGIPPEYVQRITEMLAQ